MSMAHLILGAIVAVTILGDYALKLASVRASALLSPWFMAGALSYAISAAGWVLLMKTHNLAQIGALYSSATIIVLATIGYCIFKEDMSNRQIIGIGTALLTVYLMN